MSTHTPLNYYQALDDDTTVVASNCTGDRYDDDDTNTTADVSDLDSDTEGEPTPPTPTSPYRAKWRRKIAHRQERRRTARAEKDLLFTYMDKKVESWRACRHKQLMHQDLLEEQTKQYQRQVQAAARTTAAVARVQPVTRAQSWTAMVEAQRLDQSANAATIFDAAKLQRVTEWAISDSGATGHFLVEGAPVVNKRKATHPLRIRFPFHGDALLLGNRPMQNEAFQREMAPRTREFGRLFY